MKMRFVSMSQFKASSRRVSIPRVLGEGWACNQSSPTSFQSWQIRFQSWQTTIQSWQMVIQSWQMTLQSWQKAP